MITANRCALELMVRVWDWFLNIIDETNVHCKGVVLLQSAAIA
jgi:hypothetical protein